MSRYPNYEEDELQGYCDAIRDWTGTFGELLEYVREHWSSYGFVDVKTAEVASPKGVTTVYTFVTGGWSDNEALIGALDKNQLAFILGWESSHRGGLHVWSTTAPKLAMKMEPFPDRLHLDNEEALSWLPVGSIIRDRAYGYAWQSRHPSYDDPKVIWSSINDRDWYTAKALFEHRPGGFDLLLRQDLTEE